MSDIVKVTEEEFDDEGNLVRRVITEYGTPKLATGGVVKRGYLSHLDPSFQGQIISATPDKYQLWNGDVKLREFSDPFNYGSLHSHRVGGTDRNGYGEVSSFTVDQLADNGED